MYFNKIYIDILSDRIYRKFLSGRNADHQHQQLFDSISLYYSLRSTNSDSSSIGYRLWNLLDWKGSSANTSVDNLADNYSTK